MWTYNYTYPNYICHHGIKGMKWGVRRYQNEDGTLTAAGKKRAVKSLTKEYRKSRKDDPRTDFLKLNRANSAARDYYRTQRTRNFITYRNAESKMNRKISGLSKDQIENGRYRVARARNIAAKSIAGLAAAGVGVVTLGTAPAAALLTVPITAVGMNYLNGGHYYQGQSATYGSRKAAQKVDVEERNKKRALKSSKKVNKNAKSSKKANNYDEEAEIWKALAAGNVKPANDSSTLRGIAKDLIDDRRRR